MLNPRQIEAFRALIITGGVTAAAQALSISQPAATRLIHGLQHALGLKLFVRRGARLVPTNEALSLYREVERQFVGLERIQAAAQSLREKRMGTLRVAALPAFHVGFLPRLMGHYLRERPGLDVALYGSISSQVADWVASGFCELGFAHLPLDYPALDVEPLPPIAAVAVLPDKHPLGARQLLEPGDFAGQPFICLEPSSQLRYRIDALFACHHIAREMRMETPLSMIACALVSAGAGVSIVDPFTAAEYSGRGVVVRPLQPQIMFGIAAIWASGRVRSALARDFADQVRAAVADQVRAAPAGPGTP